MHLLNSLKHTMVKRLGGQMIDKIIVYTESGSWYNLYKSYQGLQMSNAGIYNELKKNHGDKVEIIQL